MDGHNYITDDDFLRDVRNLKLVLDPLSGAPSDQNITGGLSTKPQVAERLDRISDITDRDVLYRGGSGLSQEEDPSGGVSMDGTMPGEAPLEEIRLDQLVSPEGSPLEAPPAGASVLQEPGHSRLDVTPAVTHASAAAARSLLGRNVSNRSSSAYLTAIATDRALPELQELGLDTTVALPDIAHKTNGAESAVKSAYAATNVQRRSVGEESEIIPSTVKKTMTPAKLEWKMASDKEVASLKRNNVYTPLPVISVSSGHNIIGGRWVHKVRADNLRKGRIVVLG